MFQGIFNTQSRTDDVEEQKKKSSSDLFYMIVLFNEQQKLIEEIQDGAEDDKEERIAIARQKYEQFLRTVCGITDQRDIDRITQEFLRIDSEVDGSWLYSKEEAEAEKNRRKAKFLEDNYGDQIRKAQQELQTEMVTDAFTGETKTQFKVPVSKIELKAELAASRALVIGTLPDACRLTGVSIELMQGMWGIESTYGANRLSSTGCTGDWQFTRTTWTSMIQLYGDKIAAALTARNLHEQAAIVKNYYNLLQDPDPKRAREKLYQYAKDPVLQALRNDEVISTYASAFYIKHIAEVELKGYNVSTTDPKSFGIIYASYNVGSGNAEKLMGALARVANAGAYFKEAGPNWLFYKNGETGTEALENYSAVVQRKIQQYKVSFEPNAAPDANPTTYAFTNATNGSSFQQQPGQAPVVFSQNVNQFLNASTFNITRPALPAISGTGFGNAFNGASNSLFSTSLTSFPSYIPFSNNNLT